MSSKVAVILAGGKGTRLHPFTISIPKPLVPVDDKPILEMMIIRLARNGFSKVIITVNHQAEIIMAYFGDGKKWGISIEYSLEEKPLGTIGPLKLIDNLPKDFLLMNGDVLTDLNFSSFLNEHIDKKELFTISCHKREQKVDYGVLSIQNNKLVGFSEKPVTEYYVSMGVYAINRKIIDLIPGDSYFGFDSLMEMMLKRGLSINVIEHEGYWMDVGRPDDYERATEDVKNGKFII